MKSKYIANAALLLTFIFSAAFTAEAHFEHQITVTKTLNKSMTWSDFARGNKVTEHDVLSIPAGITLNIDTDTQLFHTLVVDGTLKFAPNKSAELKTGTIVIHPAGTVSIHPESKNIKSTITLGGYAPYDPEQMSVGLIAFGGTLDIAGTPLVGDAYSKISVQKGAATVQVSENFHPNVGDELMFSDSQTADASHWSYSHYDLSLVTALSQKWEMKTVAAVNGTTVTLDSTLQYAHTDYVADLTRNVVIRSIDSTHRAHVIAMGDTKVVIKNAQFKDLGRTDALEVVSDTNIQGRYALHMHHLRQAFLLEGNVVTGSVVDRTLNNTIEHAIHGSSRWGIVNHDSFGDIRNNVVVGAAAAGIVGEDGTEAGTVTGNIVVGTGQATGGGDDGRFAPTKGVDLGYGGFGYWFHGPFLNVDNNIATGYFKQGGFGYFLHPEFSRSQLPDVVGMPADLKGKNININSRGVRSFAHNTATGLFGSAGFIMFYTSVPHSITNFTEVNRNTHGRGFEVEYTQKLDIIDSHIEGAGGVALWTNKETKEITTPGSTFVGFEKWYTR